MCVCVIIVEPMRVTVYYFFWIRHVLGRNSLGYELSWVRVVLGTICPGYELPWARGDLGTSWLGYELSWVRVVLGTSCPDPFQDYIFKSMLLYGIFYYSFKFDFNSFLNFQMQISCIILSPCSELRSNAVHKMTSLHGNYFPNTGPMYGP